MSSRRWGGILLLFLFWSCNKKSASDNTTQPPANFNPTGVMLDGVSVTSLTYNNNVSPVIKFSFSTAVNKNTVNTAFSFSDHSGVVVPYAVSYENNDNTVVIEPLSNLKYLSKYSVAASQALKSVAGGSLVGNASVSFITRIDSSRKFPIISDDALLDLVQQQTFKYFWD